jgi:hypothetical protein
LRQHSLLCRFAPFAAVLARRFDIGRSASGTAVASPPHRPSRGVAARGVK